MWTWRFCSYNLNMIFSSSAICWVSILILTIPLPSTSAPTNAGSESAKSEAPLGQSMYEDAASDPHFPWTYARVKRQLYREYIPHHRPLSGNIYAQHAGFPHPGRWQSPGTITRPDPNSGHHFESPNVILTEEDFQRYGSTLQHLDNQHHKPAPILGNEYGVPVRGNEYGAPVRGNEYGVPIAHGHTHGNAHGNSHGHGQVLAHGGGGNGYGNEAPSGDPIVEDGIVHHNGEDLPVKILHHHHYHDPIVLDPIVHAVDPKDQEAVLAFNQDGGPSLQQLGIPLGHGQNQLAIPEGQAYGHGHGGGHVQVHGGHGGHGHGGGLVQVQAPINHGPPAVPVPVSIPVQPHQGYPPQVSHGHVVQEEAYGGLGGGLEELGGKFPGHAHAQGHGDEQEFEHPYGFGHPHSHLATLKNKPLSHLFNFHNLFFGPSRKPAHHTPILKSLWPSAYGKWRHRPFSWQFSY